MIKDFIASKLKVDGDILIVNAHRIGNPSESRRRGRPRSLIAKFLYFKDMSRVKRAGRNLRGTSYGMNEQFPVEVEERRKKLYPIAKAERRKGKKVVLVRDKLFVENEAVDLDEYPYTAPATVRPCPPPRRKRARVGSTPDNSSSFSEVRASTPYVNVS